MVKNIVLGSMLLGMILFSGCCGSTGSSGSSYSSSCTTYGEACTDICIKIKGTEYDTDNCFSDCMDNVRLTNNADATTCCKETINQNCQRTCDSTYDRMLSQYGDAVDETRAEFNEPCMAECTGIYVQLGISTNSCSVIDTGAAIDYVNSQ